MASVRSLCCLLAVVSGLVYGSDGASYFEGYQLLAVTPTSKDHVIFLNTLAIAYEELDFWQPPRVNMSGTVLVPSELVDSFKGMLREKNIPCIVVSEDISDAVEATYPKRQLSALARDFRSTTGFHTAYHTYEEIQAFLGQLASLYPNNIKLSVLKHLTHENRQVTLVKLQGKASTSPKPSIVVEGGIHAREWISPAANLFAIEKLLEGYHRGSQTAMAMLDKYDWYFVPVTNPDGYAYTHVSGYNRMWRKNKKQISRHCVGVDLNRNYDIDFGRTGVSSSCSSDIYPGSGPFSEPETANMRDLVHSLNATIVSYLSIHAYSQFLLVPWGYTEYYFRPSHSAELDRVANLMASAITGTHGMTYDVGTAWQLLQYAASGAAEDWALSAYPNIYAYCYELRPGYLDNAVGFLLPPDQIIPTGEEYLFSLEVLASEMKV